MSREWAIELGDVVAVLKDYEDNVFDAVCCDPPYGLSFMGKRWDYDVPGAELWAEVLRVCKPGAPLIAFSGTRTYHRTVVQIEDAGWEIRDQIAWMYGSGFPKSLDVSKAIDAAAGAEREVLGVAGKSGSKRSAMAGDFKGGEYFATAASTDLAREWSGYGTALKPAFEPAVLARKPLEGTVAANVAKWGVGALNIDGTRIEGESTVRNNTAEMGYHGGNTAAEYQTGSDAGRWPANVILDEEAGAILGEPARFFYCAKASRSERDKGCEDMPAVSGAEATDSEEGQARLNSPRTGAGRTGGARNVHPTVKPIALTEYLAKLLLPPKPGVILVPFAGSGSEMIGALRAGWPAVVGIEREAQYVEIAQRRLRVA